MKVKSIMAALLGLVVVSLMAAILIGCNGYEVQHIQLESFSSYIVEDDIDEVVVKGNPDGELLYGICITIAERENDLILTLDNANFKAKQNSTAILCKNTSFKLTVRFKGQSTVIGGTGFDGADGTSGLTAAPWNWFGRNGTSGQCAISCGKVVFEKIDQDATLMLKGGDGGDGGDAGCSDIPLNINLVFDKPSGGNGGDGAPALKCNRASSEYANITHVAGCGGIGGKAGHCRLWFAFLPTYGQDGSSGKMPGDVEAR